MPAPLGVDHGLGFNAIYDRFKPGMLGSGGDQHIRFNGRQLYTHNSFTMHGLGAQAAESRGQKYQIGAAQVQQALVRDFGPDIASRILANVGQEVGRDLGQGITRSDLSRIKAGADAARKDVGTVVEAASKAPTSAIGQAFAVTVGREFATENLEFTQAVADLRKTAPEGQAAKARAIFDRHIVSNSPGEVNIDSGQRRAIVEAFREGAPPPRPEIFDDAFNEVSKLLKEGPARTFVKA